MLQRIPLSQSPINKNQDIEIENANKWFREFISEKDWEQRKNKIEDYLSGIIRTSEPFSEAISEGILVAIQKLNYIFYI